MDIVEAMNANGWNDIWVVPVRGTRHHAHVYVGVWTGPQNDLLCLKTCSTNEEAERFLSPMGHTIKEAVYRAECLMEKIRFIPNPVVTGQALRSSVQ